MSAPFDDRMDYKTDSRHSFDCAPDPQPLTRMQRVMQCEECGEIETHDEDCSHWTDSGNYWTDGDGINRNGGSPE